MSWPLRRRRRGCQSGVLSRLIEVLESTRTEVVLQNNLQKRYIFGQMKSLLSKIGRKHNIVKLKIASWGRMYAPRVRCSVLYVCSTGGMRSAMQCIAMCCCVGAWKPAYIDLQRAFYPMYVYCHISTVLLVWLLRFYCSRSRVDHADLEQLLWPTAQG